ncbi:MAG TPA: hypothetical protein VFU48_15975, partial [Nitrospira sp.]|nr:hypothetical protein [Nitrospira sp.]
DLMRSTNEGGMVKVSRSVIPSEANRLLVQHMSSTPHLRHRAMLPGSAGGWWNTTYKNEMIRNHAAADSRLGLDQHGGRHNRRDRFGDGDGLAKCGNDEDRARPARM